MCLHVYTTFGEKRFGYRLEPFPIPTDQNEANPHIVAEGTRKHTLPWNCSLEFIRLQS